MMDASACVGRVGGLAVALGVGVALFTGSGVALADQSGADSGGDSNAASSSGGGDSPSGQGHRGAPAAHRDTPGTAGGGEDSGSSARPARGRPAPAAVDTTAPEAPTREVNSGTADSGPVSAPVLTTGGIDPVPAERSDEPAVAMPKAEPETTEPNEPEAVVGATDPQPEPAAVVAATITDPVADAPSAGLPPAEPAPADHVFEFLAGGVGGADGATTDPLAPVDSPLAWTLLAETRRLGAGASVIATPPAAVTTTSQASSIADPFGGLFDVFNVSVSFSGLQLLQWGSASAHSEGMGSFAVAFLPGSVADAQGQFATAQAFGYNASATAVGVKATALVRGDRSTAWAHDGIGNSAKVTGDNASAEAGYGDRNEAAADGGGASAQARLGNHNTATAKGAGARASAGIGDRNTAKAEGARANAIAEFGDDNTATATGDDGSATAGHGDTNTVYVKGAGSAGSATIGNRNAVKVIGADSTATTRHASDTTTRIEGDRDTAIIEDSDNSTLDIVGDDSTADASFGDTNTATITGNGSTATVGRGRANTATVTADDSVAKAGGGDHNTIAITADATTITANGSNTTISYGGPATSTAAASTRAAAGTSTAATTPVARTEVSVSGDGNSVSGGGAGQNVEIAGSGNAVTLSGSGNALDVAGTDNDLAVGGSGNAFIVSASASGNHIHTGADATGNQISVAGTDNTLAIDGAKLELSVKGSSNSVTYPAKAPAAPAGQPAATGTGAAAARAAATVAAITAAETGENGNTVSIDGENNTLTLDPLTANNTITITGQDNTVEIGTISELGNDYELHPVTAVDNVIGVHGDQNQVLLKGSFNTVDINGSTRSTIDSAGDHNLYEITNSDGVEITIDVNPPAGRADWNTFKVRNAQGNPEGSPFIYAGNVFLDSEMTTTGGRAFFSDFPPDNVFPTEVLSVPSKGVYARGDNLYVATKAGLALSTDGGWTFTTRTTTDGLASNTVRRVVADDNGNIYAATDQGLSISADGGQSFTTRTTADGLGNNSINDVRVDNGTVYAATRSGLSISTDGGQTFTSPLSGGGVSRVYVANGVIYAGTARGLSISTDGGQTFTTRTTDNGLDGNVVTAVYVDDEGWIYAGTDRPSAGIYGKALCISKDGGQTFKAVKSVRYDSSSESMPGVTDINEHGGNVVITTTGGIYTQMKQVLIDLKPGDSPFLYPGEFSYFKHHAKSGVFFDSGNMYVSGSDEGSGAGSPGLSIFLRYADYLDAVNSGQ